MAAAGEQYEVPRSFFVVIKDLEQESCFILMLWSLSIMGYKSRIAMREKSMLSERFFNFALSLSIFAVILSTVFPLTLSTIPSLPVASFGKPEGNKNHPSVTLTRTYTECRTNAQTYTRIVRSRFVRPQFSPTWSPNDAKRIRKRSHNYSKMIPRSRHAKIRFVE